MDKYYKKVITGLFLAVIALLFIFLFVKSIDFTWKALVLGLAISLLSSFFFFIIFRQFDKEKEEDFVFAKTSTNSKMGEQYWIEFIKDLSSTKEDVIFYGSKMKLWLDRPVYKNVLVEKLKNKRVSTKIYFILHNEEYYDKWTMFFKNENIDVITIKSNEKNAYSMVRCGSKLSIVLRTNVGRSEDSPTFEIPSQSDVGKLFLEDLHQITQNNN